MRNMKECEEKMPMKRGKKKMMPKRKMKGRGKGR